MAKSSLAHSASTIDDVGTARIPDVSSKLDRPFVSPFVDSLSELSSFSDQSNFTRLQLAMFGTGFIIDEQTFDRKEETRFVLKLLSQLGVADNKVCNFENIKVSETYDKVYEKLEYALSVGQSHDSLFDCASKIKDLATLLAGFGPFENSKFLVDKVRNKLDYCDLQTWPGLSNFYVLLKELAVDLGGQPNLIDQRLEEERPMLDLDLFSDFRFRFTKAVENSTDIVATAVRLGSELKLLQLWEGLFVDQIVFKRKQETRSGVIEFKDEQAPPFSDILANSKIKVLLYNFVRCNVDCTAHIEHIGQLYNSLDQPLFTEETLDLLNASIVRLNQRPNLT